MQCRMFGWLFYRTERRIVTYNTAADANSAGPVGAPRETDMARHAGLSPRQSALGDSALWPGLFPSLFSCSPSARGGPKLIPRMRLSRLPILTVGLRAPGAGRGTGADGVRVAAMRAARPAPRRAPRAGAPRGSLPRRRTPRRRATPRLRALRHDAMQNPKQTKNRYIVRFLTGKK